MHAIIRGQMHLKFGGIHRMAVFFIFGAKKKVKKTNRKVLSLNIMKGSRLSIWCILLLCLTPYITGSLQEDFSCNNEAKLISAGRCMSQEEIDHLGQLGERMQSRFVGDREPLILVPGIVMMVGFFFGFNQFL